MVACIAVGGLMSKRLNLDERLSIPGEVSLCWYPAPAGQKPTAGLGSSCQHFTNQNKGVWPKEKSMGRWKGVIQHPSKNHIKHRLAKKTSGLLSSERHRRRTLRRYVKARITLRMCLIVFWHWGKKTASDFRINSSSWTRQLCCLNAKIFTAGKTSAFSLLENWCQLAELRGDFCTVVAGPRTLEWPYLSPH